MSRLTKIAILSMVVAWVSIVVFFAVWATVGRGPAMVWALVACLPLQLGRLFKGRGPDWDERERRIGARSLLGGYWLFWVFAGVMTAVCAFELLKPDAMVPASSLAWYLVGGVWVLLIGRGVGLLWYQRGGGQGRLTRTILFGLLLMFVVVPVVALGVTLALPSSWLSRSNGFGAHAEADEWRITADGQVVARSDITLARWPATWPDEPAAIRICLPYEDGQVTAATLDGVPAKVTRLTGGYHDLRPPPPDEWGPWQHEMALRVDWIVPLETIEATSDRALGGAYRAELRSLIPTHSFRLRIVAEPDSGFEIADGEDGRDWVDVFSNRRGDGGYDTVRGSCGMCIQKIEE